MNNRKVDNPNVSDEFLINSTRVDIKGRIKLCHDYMAKGIAFTYLIHTEYPLRWNFHSLWQPERD